MFASFRTDGVDHSAAELGDTRCGRALPWFGAHGFRDDSAECGEVDHTFKLVTVRGRAGGENDRILKGETGRLNVKRGAAGAHCRATPPAEPTPVPEATRRS